MIKQLFLTSMLVFCGAAFSQSAAVYFEIIPEQHLLQIESNRRKDMVDMLKAGHKAEVPNRLGGTSEMTNLTDDYVRIQVSESGSFEMKLIPQKNGEMMIAVIKTTCAPARDSEISFYTTTWELLPLKDHFSEPRRINFFNEPSERKDAAFQQAYHSIDMDLVKYSFDLHSNAIIAEPSYATYLPQEIYTQVKPYLKEKVLIPLN